jgi:hypothetical protein
MMNIKRGGLLSILALVAVVVIVCAAVLKTMHEGDRAADRLLDRVSQVSIASKPTPAVPQPTQRPTPFHVSADPPYPLDSPKARPDRQPLRPFDRDAVKSAQPTDSAQLDALANQAIEFVRQPVDWDGWGRSDLDVRRFLAVKTDGLNALGYLGHLGSDAAIDFLKLALSEEGSREIIDPWVRNIPSHDITSYDSLMGRFRGQAGFALADSGQDPQIRSLIESVLASETQRLIGIGTVSSHLFNHLTDATVKMDIIRDLGFEAHERLLDDADLSFDVYHHYYRNGDYLAPLR